MAKKVPFNELKRESDKIKRLQKYADADAELGTKTVLARVVKSAKIKDLANGSKQAIIRVAIYDAATKETEFVNMFAYIAEGKNTLENFYAGLTKGQLVSVQFKINNGFHNVYTMMDRSQADKTVEVEAEAELTV